MQKKNKPFHDEKATIRQLKELDWKISSIVSEEKEKWKE